MVSSVAVEHACRLVRLLARKADITCVDDTTLVPARREETAEHATEQNGGRDHDRHHGNLPRGLTESVFDTVPESAHGLASHQHTITSRVLDLPRMAEKRGGRWVPKPYRRDPSDTAEVTESQATIDRLAPRYDALVDISGHLQQAHVAAFFIVACNLGRDRDFLAKLNGVLGVPVVSYNRLVSIAESVWYLDDAQTRVKEVLDQIWLSRDGTSGRPAASDPAHVSFRELPSRHRVRVG